MRGGARRLLVKGRWLLVAPRSGAALFLLDLQGSPDQAPAEVPLPASGPACLFADGRPGGRAWGAVATDPDERRAGTRLFLLDLAGRAIVARAQVQETLLNGCLSPDGRWLLGDDRRGRILPAEAHVFLVDPARRPVPLPGKGEAGEG